MQITLKQTDIEKSLKEYIATQGIRTEGKSVNIVFTAGRRGTGITAEIAVEDIHQEVQPLTPMACGIQSAPPKEVIEEANSIAKALTGMPTLAEPEPEPEPANDTEVAPVKTTSLFG